MRKLLIYIPWIIAGALLVALIYFVQSSQLEMNYEDEINSTIVLDRIEKLGKLELMKHHFSEIIEIERNSNQLLIFRQLIGQTDADLKAVLISRGEAIACIDLAQIKEEDLRVTSDRVEVKLPPVELCNYKLDLENTKLYSLESGFFVSKAEERKFIETAYKEAERRMKEAALAGDLLKSAEIQAETLIQKMLSTITQKQVIVKRELRIDIE